MIDQIVEMLVRKLTAFPVNAEQTRGIAGLGGVLRYLLLGEKIVKIGRAKIRFGLCIYNNITHFLTELGTGFAYVGKEYRLEVGQTENFIDLLFYNLNLSCYVVIEVKIGKFEFSDIGQLGGYVVACNHQLRKEGRDNPTIGLLICKEKDRVQAQYALESSSQPLGISEYDLEKFYPEKVEGTIPTIEEIEAKLSEGNEE